MKEYLEFPQDALLALLTWEGRIPTVEPLRVSDDARARMSEAAWKRYKQQLLNHPKTLS